LFIAGRQFAFVMLILSMGLVIWALQMARKGKLPFLRKLAAIEAIDQAIGRAVEMGRPVHLCPGIMELNSTYAAEILAGVSACAYAARLAVRYGAEFIPTVCYTDTQALLEEAVRVAYFAEGKGEQYKVGTVRYAPATQPYDVFIVGIASTQRPAANICIGPASQQSTFTLEAMYRVGAMSLGGTARTVMSPIFVGACDYFLLGEEVLAVGAYVSEDPTAKGSIRGQDLVKYLFAILVLAGSLLVSFGSNILITLTRW